ncbi:MAG: MoxR family ATPase [Raineya sp.]|nr:MoxR family ATPase [Raineya sp.]MDW8295947.1 MoxR family ATPase [Raineya sp.]
MEQQEQIFQSRINLSELNEKVKIIRQEVAKVVVGQNNIIDLLLTAILADGHVLLEGVPGVAKTLMAKTFAKITSIQFSRIQFTPDLMPSDVIGTSVFNLKTSEFEFHEGPIFANLVLIDEINRAPAKTQAALFEVMEERQITFAGTTYLLQPPFLVLATQNPIEQEGTYRLPEAQLDRFLFKLQVNYPSLEEEIGILSKANERKTQVQLDVLQPVLTSEEIISYRKVIKEIHIERHLLSYIAQIIARTRNNHALYLGASPRASLALLNASKAFAALDGRDFVTPEDIKSLVPHVLRHRIVLSPEKEIEGISVEDVIHQILQAVEVPR